MQNHVHKNRLDRVEEYIDKYRSRAQFTEMMADATRENPQFQQDLIFDLRRSSRSVEEFTDDRT